MRGVVCSPWLTAGHRGGSPPIKQTGSAALALCLAATPFRHPRARGTAPQATRALLGPIKPNFRALKAHARGPGESTTGVLSTWGSARTRPRGRPATRRPAGCVALASCLGPALHKAITWAAAAVALLVAAKAALWLFSRRGLKDADLKVPEYSLKGLELPAKVVKVYDGDTVHVVMRTGLFAPLCRYKIRLEGVDTPELKTQNPKERKAAEAARDRLAELVFRDGLLIRCRCGGFDKYGRLLGELFVDTWFRKAEKSVNELLVEEGHAYAYDGGTKLAYGEA